MRTTMAVLNRCAWLLALMLALPAPGAELVLGASAPEVRAKLLDSTLQFQLSANRGKVTIINFWATWCAPCKAEMPALQAYYDRHKGEGLELLAISMDEPGKLAEVRQVVKEFSFAVALKTEADFKALGRIWRMPSTFVIDRKGILRKNGHEGEPEVTLPQLEALVTPLLTQP